MPKPSQHLRHFDARQLPAFAGFGALGDLDLDLAAIEQILGRDAESTRRDLFDRRGRVVAVPAGYIARGILAAFAAVGFGTDAVHRDGKSLVRLGTEGA